MRSRPMAMVLLATAISWVVWFAIVLGTDPDAIGWAGIVVFSVALFAAVAGTATTVGLFLRRRAADPTAVIRTAVRQGVLVGVAVTVAVFLQFHDALSWVNVVFLIAALTLLELFWISLRSKRTTDYGLPTTASGSDQP